MKIIYVTDIHDALKELRVLLSSTEADLYLLSGDILYKAFYDEDKLYDFVCLQEEFWTLAKESGEKSAPFDLAANILRFPDRFKEFNKAGDLEQKAADYRKLFEKAAKNMKEKYELIEDLLCKFGDSRGARCVMLPGNYDIDLRYTALRDRDMHQQTQQFHGLKFAGYGGAPIATSGIPEKLAVAYHESSVAGRLYSEPQDFFEETVPDVMVIHNPAYGYFDRVPMVGHVGSHGLRNYLDDHRPKLVVSGHIHEDYGVALKNGVILMNPSNFGGVDSPYGWQAGGAYCEIFIENQEIASIKLLRLVEDKSYTLMNIRREEQLHAEPVAENREHAHIDLSVFLRDASGVAVAD